MHKQKPPLSSAWQAGEKALFYQRIPDFRGKLFSGLFCALPQANFRSASL